MLGLGWGCTGRQSGCAVSRLGGRSRVEMESLGVGWGEIQREIGRVSRFGWVQFFLPIWVQLQLQLHIAVGISCLISCNLTWLQSVVRL